MKFLLAFVLVLFLVFQTSDLRHVSGKAVADDGAVKDDTVTDVNWYNNGSMKNSSFGSVEETDGHDNSTNTTFMDLDTSAHDFPSNDSADEDDTGKNGQSFFHDDAEGIIVIFVIAIIIAAIFLFPVFNHCRKSYMSDKPVIAKGQVYYLPRYQELMQRDHL